MNRRGFKELHEQDSDEYEEYVLTSGRNRNIIHINESPKKWSKFDICKTISICFVAAVFLYFFGSWMYLRFDNFMKMYTKFMQENPVEGIILYILFFMLGHQIFIPPAAFVTVTTPTFMSLFGTFQGIFIHFLIIYVAEHSAFFISYYLGRYCCRIGEVLSKRVEHFDVFNNMVTTQGIKIVFLLRCTLVIPYTAINYILSITDVSLFDYFVGNHGFILDFIVATYVGVSLSSINSIDTKSDSMLAQIAPKAIGIIFVLGIILYVIRLAQKEFERMVKK